MTFGEELPVGLRPSAVLRDLPSALAGTVDGPDLGPWLRRKKDARLLARAAQLALPAAGRAMRGYAGDPEELAIFVAVGREPPDDAEAEASLAAMARGGRLDPALLGGPGRDLYPPLLPLRTLPNMVLAHVAIQHGIRGENGVYAGDAEAGFHAWRAAEAALSGGRVAAALVGAAYSGVDLASARDRLRLGRPGAPGEGAVFVLLTGPGFCPRRDIALEERVRAERGDLGPVLGLMPLLLDMRDSVGPHGEP